MLKSLPAIDSNHSNESIGEDLLKWWIALVADEHDLDPNDSNNQMDIIIQSRSMDDALIIHAGLEKAIKKAACGEFDKAGAIFRELIAVGAEKKTNDYYAAEKFNTVAKAGIYFSGLIETKKKQDKARISSRQDQIDKRAFQAVVTANIDDYTTKAEAVRDLRVNSQFDKYPDDTLRKWLTTDVWTKPTKRGAPKKNK